MKKSLKKSLVISLAALTAVAVLFLLVGIAINAYVVQSTKEDVLSLEHDFPNEKNYDCIIVLGAGLKADGTPSNMLEDRLRRASEVYFDGASDKILVTGDNGRIEYNETIAMKKHLVNVLGVPEEDVVCDYAGFSTYDSMYRARDVFCVNSALVVTQRYHLYRALYIAQALGIDAVGTECDYHTYVGQKLRELRECAARSKDFFSTIIKPEPKFLGEKIPINEQ